MSPVLDRNMPMPPQTHSEPSSSLTVSSDEKAGRLSVSSASKPDSSSTALSPVVNTASPSPEHGNPLVGILPSVLTASAAAFAQTHGLAHLSSTFEKAALVAQNPEGFESCDMLSEEDKEALRRETTHRWNQPKKLYFLVILCSVVAVVQGMDESVINGANLFFAPQFGIDPTGQGQDDGKNQWLLGLVNSAPYVRRLVRLTVLGRRGTIFLCSCVSFAACIWQAVTNSWPHLFVARFVLGFGIGPLSSTVPVYAAECAPPIIRGALVMMWQVWTAFGIMFGYVMDLAFFRVKNTHNIKGLNWRLMLGSAGIPALFVLSQVFLCPESPRWLIAKGKYQEAFDSLLQLRQTPLQAARDLYYIHTLLEAEDRLAASGPPPPRLAVLELFTIPRIRRATLASLLLMFMQQFCGVNAIAYYSSSIFTSSGFSLTQALLASFGFGLVNFVFAFPAIHTIDTFGRRNLLLTSIPAMAVFLLLTGFAFFIPPETKARVGVVALGIYLYAAAYSPGLGPVPFTYSAEAYPTRVRDLGMSLSTAWLWLFNFIVAITFPRLLGAFKPQGAFGWYAGWNIIGFILILLLVPETKASPLEELDKVFSVPTHTHASYQLKALPRNIKKHILRMNVEPLPPLYDHEREPDREKTHHPSTECQA